MLCACGCGKETWIATKSCPSLNWTKGQPVTFFKGHGCKGKSHYNWKGGRTKTGSGYVLVTCPDHPRAPANRGRVFEHILAVEAAMGKFLTLPHEVHHVDRCRANNTNSNLVACEDRAYHSLLHKRLRALETCGNANWEWCRYCKKYDATANMAPLSDGRFHHSACHRKIDPMRRSKHE